MFTPSYLEQAAERMRQLAASQPVKRLESANEAETRLQIVDTVLSILGWNRDEFKPEQPTSAGGYTDYRLTIDGQERLIVEAKKVGIIGNLPKSIQKPSYQNSFLLNNCGEEMNCLLTQCQKYCADCGVPYALATTGDIWIVLIGFKSGVGWGRLRSFVFHSIEDVSRRFFQFYGLVSREAIKKNSLEEKFNGEILRKAEASIRPREQVAVSYPGTQAPNRGLIELFFESFMGDITRPDRDSMLEHCYVEDHRLNEFSRDLQQLLDAETALDDNGAIDAATAEELESAIELQNSVSNPKTILLVGNVGAGKSTFIYRFVRAQANPKRHICVVVDLINRSAINTTQDREEESELSKDILEKVARSFKRDNIKKPLMDPYDPVVLRGCFEADLGRFGQLKRNLLVLNPDQYKIEEEEFLFNLSKDRYKHLVGYLRYLHKKKRLAWLAFDNVDRGSESYQKFVYAYAHKLAAEANCVTLITLREDTYLEAQESGFLDVRTSDIIYRVTPPEFRQVVSKRRKYVDYLLKHHELPAKLSPNATLVSALNHHISKLVLGDDNSIRMLITTFSLNNMRYSLRMLRSYYSSYHCTFHEFSAKDCTTHDLRLDYEKEYERFLRVLILGSTWAYREDHSEILNIFSADPIEQTSHFLILRILAYLNINRNAPKGTVKYDKLSGDMIFLGHPRYHIDKALRKLLYAGLAISPHLPASPTKEQEKVDLPEEFQAGMKISLSAKGYFYLTKLAGNRYYQMRMAEDTVWYNEELAGHYIKCLSDGAEAQQDYGLDDALIVTDAREIFISYLRRSWFEEIRGGVIRDASLTWARIIKETVEETVLGSSTATERERTDPEKQDAVADMADPGVVAPLRRVLIPIVSHTARQKQMPLFTDDASASEPDYGKAIADALVSLGTLREGTKHRNNVYIVRVLWALELAHRAGLGPQRAADVAKIINQYGNCHVASTNVARFIRNQKKDGEYSYCWKESVSGAYVVSGSGQELLETLLKG